MTNHPAGEGDERLQRSNPAVIEWRVAQLEVGQRDILAKIDGWAHDMNVRFDRLEAKARSNWSVAASWVAAASAILAALAAVFHGPVK